MPSNNNESVDQQPSSRHAEVVNLPTSYATYVDRWAIVIGVSKYKHESLNLRYADRDAEEFYKLLLSPLGGKFKPDHVVKLTNHEATTASVTRALRSFLKKPGRDDLVIVYFACHGTPDFDRPGNVYLLTHDTDPNDIAGTALPMREIDLSLRENLLSERVVIFADTCHSAAIGGGIGRRSTGNDTEMVNRYLKEVSTARGGIALLTSAEANEVSFEDARWGGGHGVFTHYLLRGMQGEADLNQNGFVTVGELFEYVRAKVQEATEHRQHPSIGTNPYDRNLPLAITFPAAQNLAPSIQPQSSLRERYAIADPKKVVLKKAVRQIILSKKNITILTIIGCFIIAASTFIVEHQPSPPSSLETAMIDPGILKDYEILIYYPSNRLDLEARANDIREIFNSRQSNTIYFCPRDSNFFEKYGYPNLTVNPPANEIRYKGANIDGAKYLQKVLKEKFPSEQFHLLDIANQEGRYVSIFLGP